MPSSRLAVAMLLLSSCAGWEPSTPNYVAPTAESPAPSSHYAPPPPVLPGDPPSDPPTSAANDRIAISSVQLLDNCPDPVEAEAAKSIESRGDSAEGKRSGDSARRRCEQSTVQLAVRSEQAGTFRVEAIRILDGARRGVAGTTTLRQPTRWGDAGGYQAWDQRVSPGVDMQISYKLGDLELPDANKLASAEFNAYSGPFMLELDVSIDGRRQTIRSHTFSRQDFDLVET